MGVEMKEQEQQDSTNEVMQDNMEQEAPQKGSAEVGTSEDTLQGYRDLIEQQKDEITSLLENQKSLQAQIGNLINNTGVSIGNDVDNGNDVNGSKDDDGYVSLAELGKEIGVRDYLSHNMKEQGRQSTYGS